MGLKPSGGYNYLAKIYMCYGILFTFKGLIHSEIFNLSIVLRILDIYGVYLKLEKVFTGVRMNLLKFNHSSSL